MRVLEQKGIGGHKIGRNRKESISESVLSHWCERGDSTPPHGFARQILSLVRNKQYCFRITMFPENQGNYCRQAISPKWCGEQDLNLHAFRR